MKGVQHVRWRKAGHACTVRMPTPVQQGLALSVQANLHESAAQVRAHHGVGRGCVDDCHMGDMAHGKRFALFGAHRYDTGVFAKHMGFGQQVGAFDHEGVAARVCSVRNTAIIGVQICAQEKSYD